VSSHLLPIADTKASPSRGPCIAATDKPSIGPALEDAHTQYFLPSTPFDFPVSTSNADAIAAVIYTRVITFHKVTDLSASTFQDIAEKTERGFQAAVDVFPFVRCVHMFAASSLCIALHVVMV
jgi:hypothetical protein